MLEASTPALPKRSRIWLSTPQVTGLSAQLDPEQRDTAVDELIELVLAVDGILQVQSAQDAEYFCANCTRSFQGEELQAIHDGLLKAYRWQYILSRAGPDPAGAVTRHGPACHRRDLGCGAQDESRPRPGAR